MREKLLNSNMSDGPMLKKRDFWTRVAAEFLATTFFVFVVCGSALNWRNSSPVVLHISLTAGLSVATMAMIVGHLTGGLINPAVNIALILTRKISILEGVFYTVAQFFGGILGAALLYGLTPAGVRGALGTTVPAHSVNGGQAFGIEFVLTFLLVFTIFAATDPGKGHRGYEVPLSIGLCVFICHMVGIPFTGCSMNPARSFGPALIMNSWKHHWVYWVGPIPGGILAGFLYEFVFSSSKTCVNPV